MFLFSTMFLYEYAIPTIFQACVEAGYDGVEFWVETPHFWLTREVSTSGLERYSEFIPAIHAPVLDLNPCSVNRNVGELTLKETLGTISLSGKLGCKYVTIHAGRRSAVREPVEEDRRALDRYIRVSSRYAALKGVKLLLENSEPRINSLCSRAEEVGEYASRHKIGITLDVSHALKAEEFENMLELINLVKNVHVSGWDSSGRHVAARRSRKVEEALRRISDTGYDGLITVELDDLGYGLMDYKAKVEELRKEREFLESVFRR
jgi:sugar phosphate isomerase/epimerase